jgi:hypothetical protein
MLMAMVARRTEICQERKKNKYHEIKRFIGVKWQLLRTWFKQYGR